MKWAINNNIKIICQSFVESKKEINDIKKYIEEISINGLIYDTGDVEALKQKIQISLEDTVIDRFQKNIRDSFKCADYSYAAYIVQVNRLYDSILMEEQER